MINLTKVVSVIMSFLTLISSLISISGSNKPVFPETSERQKTVFDEGDFTLKSFDIFVSPLGDDKNSGSVDAPLKTPNAAKDKAKLLKNSDCGHITVWFREGVYRLSDTLLFNDEDLSDVTYRSYPNEKVVFSGAREISEWNETTVNGVTAFVTDWAVSSEKDYFNALYNGDTRLSRSVYPKTGEFSVTKALDEDAFFPESEFFKVHAAFYADKNDTLNFKNLSDVDVRILHYWNDELLPISSLDTSTGRIETQKPASMTIKEGDRFFYENVFEALCQPGEWYLDRQDGKLYYIPFEGETTENTVLNAAVSEQLITISGCSNIEFRGIEFRDSAWNICSGKHFTEYQNSSSSLLKNIKYSPNFPQGCFDSPCAVTVSDCSSISFIDCGFRCIGSSALGLWEGSHGCRIEACEFDNIGGNAVFIRGENQEDPALCTNNITVTDCHIKTYGRVFNNAIGIILVHASDCVISQNEIHDGFYTGISSGWVWGYADNITKNIKITNNLIYDIGQGWLSDMGGIYTLGIQPGSVISGNVIHDVGCYGGTSGYGGWGIYLDEGTSYMLVEKNLVYNCSSQGFHQHYGKDNTVRNNIFALNRDGQIRVTKKEDHNSMSLYNNIIVGDDSPMYICVSVGKFTDSRNLYWDYTHGSNVLSGESTSIKDRIYKTDMRQKGYYNDGEFSDPLFKDAKNGDFTLALGSPAFDSGFEAWDYSAAGTLTQF